MLHEDRGCGGLRCICVFILSFKMSSSGVVRLAEPLILNRFQMT
jgi:hypothetical protein